MKEKRQEQQEVSLGKQVRGRLYIHVSCLPGIGDAIQREVALAESITDKRREKDYNVIKYDPNQKRISLLQYEQFHEEPFPALANAWGVDLETGRRWSRSYEATANPPILHRKELLLPKDHPSYEKYAQLSKALDAHQLLKKQGIGTREHWIRHLDQAGFAIKGHSLVHIKQAQNRLLSNVADVARHRTALTRYELSAPIQSLVRAGYLDGGYRLFDYGCGKGDDVRILNENGIGAQGWDPHYYPDALRTATDIVNIGFVINVIEDPEERAVTLVSAYALAERFMVVSAMLVDRRAVEGIPHEDGIITGRNTFQKYFTQAELAGFIEAVLDEEPIAAGPGIFYVFKDKLEEQRFLSRRCQNRTGLRKLQSRRRALSRVERDKQLYQKHQNLLDGLWEQWLMLGRPPDLLEVDGLVELEETFGSLRRTLRFLERHFGSEQLEEAANARREDLLVYFALQQFEHRRPYKQLPDELRRDVKAFFGSYKAVQRAGREALFLTGSSEMVEKACRQAAEQGLGWLYSDTGFYVEASRLESLPAILRIYVSCGLQLYGDVDAVDLIKIHIHTRKLTLMCFDDFEGAALPQMLERIKIRLVNQSLQFFGYGGEYEPPYLYMKSRFLSEDSQIYEQQCYFDKKLQSLGLFNFDEYGPPKSEFEQTLARHGFEVEGFEIQRKGASKLDDSCGKYLTFRDLIECGETQGRTGIDNHPKEPETYEALWRLTTKVLDPVMDYFGGIRLTYGFCSAELGRSIKQNIAPKLDQHAACEKNRRGNYICSRLGAAVDFIIQDESMLEVAAWIAENTPFDRMYIYGDDCPLHVSVGPEMKGEIVFMGWQSMKNGASRRMPKIVKKDEIEMLGRNTGK